MPKRTVEETIAVFWSRVDKSGGSDACWNWKAGTAKGGYGILQWNGRQVQCNRISWLIHYGDPGDLFVLHKCDNPRCVNPSHLFLGTNKDNMLDMHAKGRGNRAKGERHHNAKLTNEQAIEIRRRALQGENKSALGREFNVSNVLIGKIARGEAWASTLTFELVKAAQS